ncbi:MAG: hypothetical protein M0P72_01945 [Metallibacterium scheffleri]|jgi:hypothetical protein|uniref:hypothetical protein n=1 Tax=Metallibacterium scheffleri TaxID=993689 RepID=UPI0026F18BF3|nr:hypothetical protein [Metallibacterium scheffleri]MCK9365897.1 hypothetical protein [Metallibacterium scheffleri]
MLFPIDNPTLPQLRKAFDAWKCSIPPDTGIPEYRAFYRDMAQLEALLYPARDGRILGNVLISRE